MKEICFKVKGMVCTGENRIKKSVIKLEGVEDVKASYEEGNVIVLLKDGSIEETVKEAILNLGFEIEEG